MKRIGGLYQNFKKSYEETYGKDTRDIDAIVNSLLYDESNCVAKYWRLYQEFKKGYQKAYLKCMTPIKDSQEEIESDIKGLKSLAVIIYDIGNWLREDCRKIPNI